MSLRRPVELRFDCATVVAWKVACWVRTNAPMLPLSRWDAKDLPALEFANSDSAAVGQFVYAIGVPFGQEWSFTSGMLSGKGRSRLLGPASAVPLFEDYLQTDACHQSWPQRWSSVGL
jgi:S1-C subfamily serine protease